MPDTRIVIIVRHATALNQAPGGRDYDRSLSPSGHVEAVRAGRWLAQHWPRLPHVIVSPAVRTRETFELLMAERVEKIEPEWDTALYLADLPGLLDLVARDEEDLMLIGHNPGLEDLLAFLLPPALATGLHAPPGAVFVLALPRVPVRRACAHIQSRYLPGEPADV